MTLNDKSPMPFGKHKGTPLQDVPASYLHWLWNDAGLHAETEKPLHQYIKSNMAALERELPDAIWRKAWESK